MANPHPSNATRTHVPKSGFQGARKDLRQRLLAGLPVTERRLSLNQLGTSVLEGGAGRPIVLLHGPGAYAAQWRHLIPQLVKTHRVVAPDLPGHGTSDSIDRPPDGAFLSAWLDDLIECTCSDRPVLLGHTLGGAMAAHYASERSDRLAALVLVDTFGLAPFQPSPAFGAALQAFLSNPTEHTQDGLWGECLFDVGKVEGRMRDEWELLKAYTLDRIRAPGRLSSLTQLMEQLGPAIPPEVLARITARTTLIWGRQDRATPLAAAQQASVRFGWPLHVIDDAADDPTLDEPEAFLKALQDALREASHA